MTRKAAKTTAKRRGRPSGPAIPRPSKRELERLYVRARLSVRDVAGAFGLSKDTAARALREHGIKARPRTRKRSRLADIPLSLLEANIKAEGLRGHARTLGVDPSTLLSHVRTRRAKHRP